MSGERMAKFKKGALITVVALVGLGAAYGVGRLQGYLATDEVAEQLTEVEERLTALEARRRLSMARQALESQNFGIAEQHLQAAAVKMGEAVEVSEAEPTAPISQLAQELAGTHVTHQGDIETQKENLDRLLDRFDAIAPPE